MSEIDVQETADHLLREEAEDRMITTEQLRVAAYRRLGYGHDGMSQKISFAMVSAEEERRIKANSSWIYAGSYIDKRGEWTAYGKLMDAVRAGEVDRIETRSMLRFAVNFEELFKITDELQGISKPVQIHFEQEDITTGTKEWLRFITLLFGFVDTICEKQAEIAKSEPDIDWKKIPFREERVK